MSEPTTQAAPPGEVVPGGSGPAAFAPVVLTPTGVDPERRLLQGVDTSADPVFSVGEVARAFFAKGPHWIRWRERHGFFPVLDDEGERTGRSIGHVEGVDARRYNLNDVEAMVFLLLDAGTPSYDGQDAARSLGAVYAVARVWHYLPD
jgi:hypothetical protein